MSSTDARYAVDLSDEDYQKATIEVAFLLDAFASTIDNIMGGNTAPVGRIAGRETAKKLPLHLVDPTLQEVVAALGSRMNAGFELGMEGDGLVFKGCIIREMCAQRRIEPGGPLCHLFHSYFDGIVNGLLGRPVKSSFVATGAECRFQTAIQ